MLTYDEQLTQLIANGLAEDIGDGDHSTLSCIPTGARGKAILKIKEVGILAGIDVAGKVFMYKDPSSVFKKLMVMVEFVYPLLKEKSYQSVLYLKLRTPILQKWYDKKNKATSVGRSSGYRLPLLAN